MIQSRRIDPLLRRAQEHEDSVARDLIAIGAYQRGNDPTVDEALERWPEIVEFLGQDVARAADLPSSRAALEALIQRNAAAGIPVPPGLP